MKKLIFLVFLLNLFSNADAQYKATPLIFADKAFKDGNYYEAAYYYKKAADGLDLVNHRTIPYRSKGNIESRNKAVDPVYLAYQLGESYRLYDNYLEAEGNYKRVLDSTAGQRYPLARLWYGVCLRANQRFDEAIKQLEKFENNFNGDKKYLAIAKKETENCKYAKNQYQYPLLVDVSMMKGGFNLGGSDYALVDSYQDFYFTSSRTTNKEGKHLNNLFEFKKNNRGNPKIVTFPGENTGSGVEYGTPSLCKSGSRIYFTRWCKKGSNQTIHEIYLSDLNNGHWSKPRKLNTNANLSGYNAQQPFVSKDGKKLFFTSNKPGGLGGDDIWQSDLNENGDPVNSTNLGADVNTAMDEEAPWYDATSNKLVYSSKGMIGLGGFDLYISYNHEGKWSKPQNMGYPINSAKDDLYYLPDPDDSRKFYLSSDRESECCLNIFEAYEKNINVIGQVVDCESGQTLADVKVSLVDSAKHENIVSVITDDRSPYKLAIRDKRVYQVVLEKSGYFTKIISLKPASFSRDTLQLKSGICLQPFKVNKPIALKNILYDFNKATLRPESKMALDTLVSVLHDNPKIKIELASHTDSIGSDAYNIKLSQARAQSCVDYILSKGITEDRIYAKGYGKRKPIAPNSLPNGKDNPAGRQLNRRTEFTVMKTE